MTTRDYDDEFAAIAADDALLDGLGWGTVTESDDELSRLLATWREELDDAATAMALAPFALDGATSAHPFGSRPSRRRLHRHTAALAAAAVLALAGSAGAAAATGPHGPLGVVNRALFGTSGHDDTARLALVRSLLDRAQRGIDSARAHGGASAAGLADLGEQLDTAARVLAADPAAPSSLTARLTALRAELAALDTLPTSPPQVSNTGQSARSGSTPTGAGTTHSGDDGTGVEGNDGSSGSDDGSDGSSGSDDGTSGSDGGSSGSGDGTSTSGGGSSGSDDGSTTSGSGSGGDGTSSDGGTSGSDGGTSGSDGGTSGGGTSSGGSDSGSTDGGSSDGGTSGSDGGSSAVG
jgi:hypothetical protein